jgi:CHAD domain-containing protein
MRVALRRLRSALATFERCFSRRRLRPVREGIRRIGRRLGAVRDADVHLALLRGALGGATAADRPGIAYAIEYVSARRRAALARFAIELSQFDRDECGRVLADV